MVKLETELHRLEQQNEEAKNLGELANIAFRAGNHSQLALVFEKFWTLVGRGEKNNQNQLLLKNFCKGCLPADNLN